MPRRAIRRDVLTLLSLAAGLGCSGDPEPTPPAKPAAAPAPVTKPAPRVPTAPPAAPIAAARATGRPASVTDAQVATADKVIAWLHEFSGTVAAAGVSCHTAAQLVKSSIRTFDPVAKELGSLVRALDADAAATEWFESNYGLKVTIALMPLQNLATFCANDKELTAAIDAAAHHAEAAMGPLPSHRWSQ